TVGPARTGLKLERRGPQPGNVLGERLSFLACHLIDVAVAHRAAPESGNVSEKVLDRDVTRCRHRSELRRWCGRALSSLPTLPPASASRRAGRSDGYFLTTEFRDVARDRIVQA